MISKNVINCTRNMEPIIYKTVVVHSILYRRIRTRDCVDLPGLVLNVRLSLRKLTGQLNMSTIRNTSYTQLIIQDILLYYVK